MFVLLHHIFKYVVNLHQLATISSQHFIRAIVTIHINQIGLHQLYLLTLHDDLSIDLVLVFLKCLILCLLFTKLPPFLLTDDFLFLCFYFVHLSLLNCVVFCFDSLLMVFLSLVDAIDNNCLSAICNRLVFFEEVEDFIHEPWDDLLVHCALSGWY